MANTDLPILEQRRIEANIIKPIYDEMVERLGKDEARKILTAAITRRFHRAGTSLCGSGRP